MSLTNAPFKHAMEEHSYTSCIYPVELVTSPALHFIRPLESYNAQGSQAIDTILIARVHLAR